MEETKNLPESKLGIGKYLLADGYQQPFPQPSATFSTTVAKVADGYGKANR